VQDAKAFGTTVAKALAHFGPSIVEVDMTGIGEAPVYFPYNIQKAASLGESQEWKNAE